MDIDAAEGRDRLSITRRAMRARIVCRRCGVVVSVLVGPMAAVFAGAVLGMDLIETAALLFLISAWLGPLLMGRGGL